MKLVLASLALIATMVMPALADATIDELIVRRSGADVNLRVTVRNPAPTRQAGPIMVDLYVRQDESDNWMKIKTWNNISALKSGHRVARDYFDENDMTLKQLAASGRFQARAVVTAPGQTEAVEKTSWYDTSLSDY